MKKHLLTLAMVLFVLSTTGQSHVNIDPQLQNVPKQTDAFISVFHNSQPGENHFSKYSPLNTKDAFLEEQVGSTVYDLQTNGIMSHRIYKFNDGTLGTVWTMGFDEPGFPNRGTGYNYFDGSQWGAMPDTGLESVRTGWPSYAPWGENGEIICAHTTTTGISELVISRRTNKGTGDWTEATLLGPENPNIPGEPIGLLWPSMITGGTDHQVLHVLSLTAPTANGGNNYYGQEGALLYSRSEDGGNTWSIKNQLFDELDSTYYNFILPDSYVWAYDKGETIAFIVTSSLMDAVLMKSTDGGDSWDKTIIWEHPYPNWNWETTVTDTFYCPDNSGSITLDANGKAHVVFGITRLLQEQANSSIIYFPFTDGIVYWNEDMPGFSPNVNALNPNDHPDSELEEDYNLIGWTQDMNGNGQIDFLYDIVTYAQRGVSTMPQIVASEDNYIFVIWSSTTETYHNGIYNYKHLWVRCHFLGTNWWGNFVQLTSDIAHIYDECILPSLANKAAYTSAVYFTLQYMLDTEPGLAPNMHQYLNNKIIVADYTMGVGVDQTLAKKDLTVSEFYPNPANIKFFFTVNSSQPADCRATIYNTAGVQVHQTLRQVTTSGSDAVTIDISGLSPGMYMVQILISGDQVTKKLLVR